ncbi:hypothetical protein ASG40_19380 [Methylobacterium sp. Leaf399]|uniref:hypothetical protein n=1 Tax=Methylobacterium sp. Leaf399 TaxID=1736364 RepID=UPI0007018892|nr:hypothetical protein [Methylobacterium sp. Leaf399]KQT13991.1 hypothetical protein ASG40_19380 [Methylobacterium sp. Leaf399]
MAIARFKTSGQDVRFAVSRALAPERRQQLIAAAARAGLKESQDINDAALGRVPPHDTFVDGRAEAPLESVNADRGVIVFRFSLASEVFKWIDDMLILSSPFLTGRYARSHVFFADGVQASPDAPQSGDVFVFLNEQPYARKIERGLSKQAPDGVYEGVAAMAARRFGNIARVRFGFRSLQEGAIVYNPGKIEMRAQVGKREAREIIKRERDTRQPAIIVTIN